MKDYNIFQEFIDKLELVRPIPRKKDRIAFMGKKGDEREPLYKGGEHSATFRTKAYVLCYYEYDSSVEWKCVYLNTKGHYIKYNGKNIYLYLSDNVPVVKLF